MAGLSSPRNLQDVLDVADWWELIAILAADGNASDGDLSSMLDTEDSDLGDEGVEELCNDVFEEVEMRRKGADKSYPFDFDGHVLQLQGHWQEHAAYVFCLCLTYIPYPDRNRDRSFPERLFERLATAAAKHFLEGEAVRFAAPRDKRDFSSNFRAAVTQLCKMIGEGGSCRSDVLVRRQDDGVDVVAWRDFPDGAAGKLLLFGNCASGDNWKLKLAELQPHSFRDTWMTGPNPSPVVKSFFLPHRVDTSEWQSYTSSAGIIFDRCRIAYWADRHEWDCAKHVEWTQRALKGLDAL